jgi:hypothetical protein
MVRLADLLMFAAPLFVSALALACMHWFPWKSDADILTRIEAYTAGTLVTVGVPVLAMLAAAALGLRYGELFWACLLTVNAVVSGATVKAAYWYDGKRAIGRQDVADASERR